MNAHHKGRASSMMAKQEPEVTVHPARARMSDLPIALLAAALLSSTASAQMTLSEFRADDGTAYQVIQVLPIIGKGAERVRITTIAGGVEGIGACFLEPGLSDQPTSAVAGAQVPTQALFPYDFSVRSRVLTPNDFTLAFDHHFGGRLTLGTGGAALNVCKSGFDCAAQANVESLVALSEASGGVAAACIATGISASCDGTILRNVIAFGIPASGSPPVCDDPASVTVDTKICAAEPSDGFSLNVGQAIVLVYDSVLAGSGLAIGSAGFKVDADGTNDPGCMANKVVGAAADLRFASAPPLPTATPTPIPIQAIQDLMEIVTGLQLPVGQTQALTASLDNAAKQLGDGNPANDIAACNNLSAFINKVSAQQRTGRLSAAEAGELIAMANQIKSAQGCPR
jgi:hypothetical protein